MEREDAKDLTLSILAVVAVVLLADCVWLHVKCARQADAVAALAARLERHINPPPEPTLADKAKASYERAKAATVEGYEKAKAATARQYDKAKAATAAGYQAVKEKCGKK